MSVRLYRGFAYCPLICPHVPAQNGRPHDDDAGFVTVVEILRAGTDDNIARNWPARRPFE